MRFKTLLALSITASSMLLGAEPSPGNFNVYAINNIGMSSNPYGNSDFQGIAGAGGNIYLQNFSLNANGPAQGSSSLYAGQSVSLNSAQINNGGVQAGSSIMSTNSSVFGNVVGGGNLTGSNGSVNGNVNLAGSNTSTATISGTVTQNTGSYTPTVNLAQVSNFFQNASSTYANMSQSPWINSMISFGTLSLSNLQSGLNIFNISLATEQSLNQVQFSGASDAILVFNVTGDGSSASQILKGLTMNGLSTSSILFNILNATNLALNGGPYVSVLAPTSNVTFTNGNLKGNLIGNNLYGTGQVDSDQGLFKGFSSLVSAPEPATYLVLGSMLALATIIAYRRKISTVS